MFLATNVVGVIESADFWCQHAPSAGHHWTKKQERVLMGRWTKQRQFKPDGTFYAPNEPREKMKKCTEWTEEQAIPALYASGVLLWNA